MGRCPRCQKGALFSGALTIAPSCSHCGLSFSGFEVGDGPAFFGILVIGTLAAIGAALGEIVFEWPYWLQAAIWLPFVVVGAVISLRFGKYALIFAQYHARPQDFE